MFLRNRNPRSLELQGLKLKPKGLLTTNDGKVGFFHKFVDLVLRNFRLSLELSNKHTTATVESPLSVILSTTTKEPYIRQNLFSCSDKVS